jgi:hypothetical protein
LGEEVEAFGVERVEIVGRDGDVDVDLACGVGFGSGEWRRFVVAFGAPGYVVGVAECVDVYYVCVGWGEEDVLECLMGMLG